MPESFMCHFSQYYALGIFPFKITDFSHKSYISEKNDMGMFYCRQKMFCVAVYKSRHTKKH